MKTFLICLLFCAGVFLSSADESVDLRRELPSPDFYFRNQLLLQLDAPQLQQLKHTLAEMNRNLSQAEKKMAERAKALQDAIKDQTLPAEEVEQRLNSLMQVENEVKSIRFHAGLAARRMLRPDQWQNANELLPEQSLPRTGPVASLSKEKQAELTNKLQSLRKLGEQLFPQGPPADLRRRVNEAQHKVRNGMIDDAFRLMDELIADMKRRQSNT